MSRDSSAHGSDPPDDYAAPAQHSHYSLLPSYSTTSSTNNIVVHDACNHQFFHELNGTSSSNTHYSFPEPMILNSSSNSSSTNHNSTSSSSDFTTVYIATQYLPSANPHNHHNQPPTQPSLLHIHRS